MGYTVFGNEIISVIVKGMCDYDMDTDYGDYVAGDTTREAMGQWLLDRHLAYYRWYNDNDVWEKHKDDTFHYEADVEYNEKALLDAINAYAFLLLDDDQDTRSLMEELKTRMLERYINGMEA